MTQQFPLLEMWLESYEHFSATCTENIFIAAVIAKQSGNIFMEY